MNKEHEMPMNSPLPGPWINPEIREERPWLTHEGIVKFFEFPVRIEAMSHRAFHLYWQRHHSPNVMNVTGFAQFMRKYTSGHRYPDNTLDLPDHYRQQHDLEGAAEVWINSWREVGNWLGHPLYGELIQPDEPRFIAQDERVIVLVAKEEHLHEPDRDMDENRHTKVYLLLSAKPNMSRPEFHGAVSTHFRAILEHPHLTALLSKLVISHKLAEPNPIEGLRPSDVDAVAEFWFADRNDARRFFADGTYRAAFAGRESAWSDFMKTRAITARVRVVHDEFSFQPSTTQPIPFTWSE